jgi:hypothetical protein
MAAAALLAIAPLDAQTGNVLTPQLADEPIVKGAPYSGEATTTVKMRMFDGTNIERTVTAKLFRDAAGRVRREQTAMGLEALDPSNDVRAIVLITDPVERFIYTLIPGSLTANRLKMQSISVGGGARVARPHETSLGTREIDGLTAIGFRKVTTILPGEVGNDKPIDIVDERWVARDLDVMIEAKHHDPRTGDVEYRLTKISRKEPPADLFKVPAGYKIVDISPKGPEGF